MNNPLFDMSQYESISAQSYSADWRDATGVDPAWDEPEFYRDLEDNVALATNDAESNPTEAPTMAEERTPEPKPVLVEVVEELSPEEEADRQRLELLVERAFYQAGSGLRELRERRLYRNTHKTWEEYCQDRFGYTYRFANLKIAAADVFDNLLNHFSKSDLGTNCSQKILPNWESQCRELAKLESEQQPEAWEEALQRTPGKKIPSASTVKAVVLEKKGIVERLKERNSSPSEFKLGDVVEIEATNPPLRPFVQMWGIIKQVGSFSYTVQISIARDTQQCKEEEMVKVDDEYTADIKAVAERIWRLVQNFELEPIEYDILANLQRSKCFTPKQLRYLEFLERDYGLKPTLAK